MIEIACVDTTTDRDFRDLWQVFLANKHEKTYLHHGLLGQQLVGIVTNMCNDTITPVVIDRRRQARIMTFLRASERV